MKDQLQFKFGEYSLARDTGLMKSQRPVAIPPKELALLELLLVADGGVVSHRRIEDNLWPRQVVSYASLARAVHSLRKILGGNRMEYIETLPKRGYRFAVPISIITDSPKFTPPLGTASTIPIANAHFLEGLYESRRGQPDSQARAAVLFEQAHQADATFAAPLIALAGCRQYQIIRGYIAPGIGRKLAMEACRGALAIQPGDMTARAILAWLKGSIPGNVSAGLLEVEDLLEISPLQADIHCHHSMLLRAAGKLDAAVDAAGRAVELDPYSSMFLHMLNWALFFAGRVEEAIESERQIVAEAPWLEIAQGSIAVFASYLGHHAEAIKAARKALALSKGNPSIGSALSYALARAGRCEEAASYLERFREHGPERVASIHGAAAYLALNNYDRAGEFLRNAATEGCPLFNLARFDPRIKPSLDAGLLPQVFDNQPAKMQKTDRA